MSQPNFPPAPLPGVIEEDTGILLVEGTPEYADLVARHGADQVSVRAVNLEEEGEFAFLQRVNVGFAYQPGCVIVLEAPGEGFVYQLNTDFAVVHRITLQEWRTGLGNVDHSVIADLEARLNGHD